MSDRERSDSGEFVETVTLEAVRGVFDEVRGPVVTSSDVADALECTTEAARQKLRRLYDRGEVDKRKTGRTVVYWRTSDEARQEPATDAARSEPVERSADAVDDTQAESGLDVDAAIEAVDTPGSGETLQRRREALREMYDYLREHGTARRRDFEEIVDTEDVGYGSFNSFWTNYVKAKDALKQLPNVDPPGEGEHTWYYTADPVEDADVYDPTEEF